MLNKNINNIAFSFIIILLYNGIFIGVLPGEKGISWEGHLGGAITGIALSFLFRHYKNDNPKDEHNSSSNISVSEPEITMVSYQWKEK